MTTNAKDYTKTTSFSKNLHEKYKKIRKNISNKNTYLSRVLYKVFLFAY